MFVGSFWLTGVADPKIGSPVLGSVVTPLGGTRNSPIQSVEVRVQRPEHAVVKVNQGRVGDVRLSPGVELLEGRRPRGSIRVGARVVLADELLVAVPCLHEQA